MSEWTSDWPTKTGFYWFYGHCFKPWKDETPKIEFHFVKVMNNGQSAFYVTNGHFLFKSEGGSGVWQEVVFPEVPNDTPNT